MLKIASSKAGATGGGGTPATLTATDSGEIGGLDVLSSSVQISSLPPGE